MKVLFTRSVSVNGEHCEEGSTRDIGDNIASELIASKRAIKAETDRSVGLAKSETKTKKRKAE